MSLIRLPTSDKRTAVIGSTGSGKTRFAAWLLSSRDYTDRPWCIFDFKGDEFLEQIPATPWSIQSSPPKDAGLYIVRPLPGEEVLVSNFFYKCWAQENIGIYIDEGYMLPKLDKWFRSCLTMGRSKHIEMIILSQRPVWMDKYVFTEADFFSVFRINSIEDRKHLKNFLDGGILPDLPKYHSLWYDVGHQQSNILQPVPIDNDVLNIFRKRLGKKVSVI